MARLVVAQKVSIAAPAAAPSAARFVALNVGLAVGLVASATLPAAPAWAQASHQGPAATLQNAARAQSASGSEANAQAAPQPNSQPGSQIDPQTGMPLPSAPAPVVGASLAAQAGLPAGGGQLAPPPPPPPDPRRPLPARPGAISLEQALTLAQGANPALLAARQNLEATRAQEIQAAVRANPQFTIAGQDVTLSATNPASPYTFEGQVSRLFERGQKRRWRMDGAKATTLQTEDQLHDQERSTALAVKQAFVGMLAAKAAVGLATSNFEDFAREVKINHDRYDAGDIGRLDFERLDLQLSQFESDLANAEINLRQSSDQLQTLIGRETPSLDFDILGTIVPPEVPLDLTTLDAKALAARPDYQAAIAGVALADANVKLAYANGTTDPTLEGEYDRVSTYNSAGFNLSIPLRIFDRNQGNKKTSGFAAQASRFSVIAAKNQVLSDVDQAWIGYTQSKILSDRYTGHYLDEAADVLSIAQFAYEHGGIALIDYLDALRDSRTATSSALAAYQNTWLAIHQLSYAAATEVAP
jgi:cobalt-zinc-cadmium efflux system outer membrane protein